MEHPLLAATAACFQNSNYLEIKVDALRIILKSALHLPRNQSNLKLLHLLIKGFPGLVAATLRVNHKLQFQTMVFSPETPEEHLDESVVLVQSSNSSKTSDRLLIGKKLSKDDWLLSARPVLGSRTTNYTDDLSWVRAAVKCFRDDTNLEQKASRDLPRFAQTQRSKAWSQQSVFYFMFDVCRSLMQLDLEDPLGHKSAVSPISSKPQSDGSKIHNAELLDTIPYIFNHVDVTTQCRMLGYLTSLLDSADNAAAVLDNRLFLSFLMRETVKNYAVTCSRTDSLQKCDVPDFTTSLVFKKSRVGW